MTEPAKNIEIQSVIDTLVKKWYLVTIPLGVFLLIGAWLYVVLPRTFEARTLILVQPQEIPSSYVQSTVGAGIDERVRTLSQEVMSRSNLEKIIKDMNLYQEQRDENVSMDLLVASMRKRIDVVTLGGARGQTSSFTITFRERDPQVVADVTNRLASFFIESHLKLRARQAAQTTLFLEKQLGDLKTLLQQQEGQVEEYRNKYMGELPEQLTSNISTISGLQMRLESVQASLAEAMNRRLDIQRQLSNIETDQPGATMSQRGQRMAELRAQLENASSRYTAEHPVVKQLRQQIDDLEKQSADGETGVTDPHVLELRNQFATINMEVEGLKADSDRLKERIEYYQQRVENTPKREQELAALTRDYNITQQNYQRLLDRLYEAKRAESMEMRQQGEQFRIVDYAQPPEIPVSPNLIRIAFVFLVLGLGTGIGFIVLLEMVDSTVKGIKQLEKWSGGISCISAVPLALTPADKRKRKMRTLMYMGINVFIAVAGVAIIIYSYMNDITVVLPAKLPF